MNINLRLSNELEAKITEAAESRLKDMIEDILKDDIEIDKLIKQTVQSQVKSVALKCLQSNELRGVMAQKVYPIIYETLGLQKPNKIYGINGINLAFIDSIEK